MKESYLKFSIGSMAYYTLGSGRPIVILHGWGQDFNSFLNVVNKLASEYKIIGLDFFGFGKSKEVNVPLTLDDYLFHFTKLMNHLNIKNPIIIAHSFGGRIALLYSLKNDVDKLILVSSAGIRRRSFQYYYKVYKYKITKLFYKLFNKTKYNHLRKTSGSLDYQNASDVMKKTLSNVVKKDFCGQLKNINCKTYLLWGINDQVTKYTDGILMNKKIKNSKLIPFYESEHFCYIDEEAKFIKTIKQIIKE